VEKTQKRNFQKSLVGCIKYLTYSLLFVIQATPTTNYIRDPDKNLFRSVRLLALLLRGVLFHTGNNKNSQSGMYEYAKQLLIILLSPPMR